MPYYKSVFSLFPYKYPPVKNVLIFCVFMLKLFIAVVAVTLIYWIWTKKNQILPKRNDESEPFITTIEAIELKTYLDWDTPVS